MTIRVHYEEELIAINREILKMALLAEQAIQKVMKSLKEKNASLSLQVIEDDKNINDMEDSLCDRVALIIAKEQPVATQLRKMIGTIKIISDIERIGDYAVHIAKRYDELSKQDIAKFLPQMFEMSEIGIHMIQDAVLSFVDDDMDKACEVAKRDLKIDELHLNMFKENLKLMSNREEDIEAGISLLFTSRFLERLGDHVKNICEWVVFVCTGDHKEL